MADKTGNINDNEEYEKQKQQWKQCRHKNKRCDGDKRRKKTQSARMAFKPPSSLSRTIRWQTPPAHFTRGSSSLCQPVLFWLRWTDTCCTKHRDGLAGDLVPSIVSHSKLPTVQRSARGTLKSWVQGINFRNARESEKQDMHQNYFITRSKTGSAVVGDFLLH